MLQIVSQTPNTNIISVESWTYDSSKVVLAEIRGIYYILYHIEGRGYIFKNVADHVFGASGIDKNPKYLVRRTLSHLDKSRVYEFNSIAEAMKFVDSNGKV